MESLLMVFGNSTEEKNYEEMNLWQEFADYAGDKGIFTVKLKAKSDVQVKDYFDFEMLKKLAALPGFTACHLF